MDLLSSNAVRVFITVFVVLFCSGLVHRVEGDRIIKAVNLGGNITLSCYPPKSDYFNVINTYCWYKGTPLLHVANINNGNFQRLDSRITQTFIADHSQSKSQYNLYITDVTYDDSTTYQCYHGNGACQVPDEGYDLRVIGCSCVVAEGVDTADMSNGKVVCELLNYVPPTLPSKIRNIHITKKQASNTDIPIVGSLQGNFFSFSVSRNELTSNLKVELSPYDDAIGNIVCTVPAQLISPRPSTHYHTSLPTPTTQNRRSAVSSTVSPPASPTASELTTGEPTKYTPPNEISSQDSDTQNGHVTLIIAIIGSLFILILIVVIIVLRCKKTKGRHKNIHNGNASTKKQQPPEVCYESVEDGSRKDPENAKSIEKMKKTSRDQVNVDDPGNGGLVDNILYDSNDRITENSISRVEGPLDNALYAMPDKRATINRESKSGVVDGSSNSDVLYGNSDIISQHEQSKDTLQRGDQYENVEMPGSVGDAEEIQLYAMPDKGPKRNTLKTNPKPEKTSTLSKDEVVDVDALYAEVDKPKKK